MRRAPQVPAFALPAERERSSWRFLAGSAVAHALIIFFLIWDWSSVDIAESRSPGGDGPIGGGGGGGAARISYVALPAYQPPPEARPTEQSVRRPQDIVIPTPTLAQVDIEAPEFEIPRETAPLPGAEILGRGAGVGGGPGAGTGSGGGIGSGRGTGAGSGVGPGTGGDGGDIFAPHPRLTTLPPEPRPRSVRGREYVLHFSIGADGRVLKVEIEPRIRDSSYRRRFIARLFEWSFAPAMTRDGTPVAGRVDVRYTL